MTEPKTMAEFREHQRSELEAFYRRALEASGWNVYAAAQALQMPATSLHNALRERFPALDREYVEKRPEVRPGMPRRRFAA